MDKIWSTILYNKWGHYKVRNTYTDDQGGCCITHLIAKGLGYKDGLVQPWLHERTKGVLSLSSKYAEPAFSNMSPYEIQHTSKFKLEGKFVETIQNHQNRVCLRDMILLNDNSEFGFDDFQIIFKELDI